MINIVILPRPLQLYLFLFVNQALGGLTSVYLPKKNPQIKHS